MSKSFVRVCYQRHLVAIIFGQKTSGDLAIAANVPRETFEAKGILLWNSVSEELRQEKIQESNCHDQIICTVIMMAKTSRDMFL